MILICKAFSNILVEKTVNELLRSLLLQSQSDGARFTKLLSSLPTFEQRNLLYALLQIISKEHLSTAIITEADSSWWKSDAKVVSGAAGLIKSLVNNEEPRKAQLLSWLTSSTGAGVGEGIAIRRAVVTALAEGKSDMETVLEKSLQQLGDQLYIKHTPTMQQEGASLESCLFVMFTNYIEQFIPRFYFSLQARSTENLRFVLQ